MGAPYTAGMTTNLFATPGSSEPVDGWLVRLPSDWTLERALVLRYGSERVPVEVRRTSEPPDAYALVARQVQRGLHDLVLRVRVGRTPGPSMWSVVPFSYDAAGEHMPQEAHRVTRRVDVQPASARKAPDAGRRALAFREAAPLLLRRERLPRLDADFTVEFWMKTTGLGEVVLSTWTGEAAEPYPMEAMVDATGRLRYYCGRQGQHVSLTTRAPLADGLWHHVALVHKAAEQRLILLHDGMAVDSLGGLTLPPAARPYLAVGGRVPKEGTTAGRSVTGRLAYSGQLDEMRIWPIARSARALNETARRTLREEQHEGLVYLGFDRDLPSDLVAARPPSVETVASDLVFNMPLRDLRATVDDGTIRLAWTAPDPRVEAFVIERSIGGEPFRTVGRVRPRPLEPGAEGPQYEFSDPRGSGQVVYYRIRQQFADGTERLSGTLKIGLGAPDRSKVTLIGSFPNPFSETTTIAYEVHQTQPVQLTVWNLSGRQIATLVDDVQAPGYYEHLFRSDNLPSGTYFVRLNTPNNTVSHKMVLLK